MNEIKDRIISDLKWLAEKTDDPIVKITYSMAISIVRLHFGDIGKRVEDVGKINLK